MSLTRYWVQQQHVIQHAGKETERKILTRLSQSGYHPDLAYTQVVKLADVRALVEEACQRLNPDVPIQYECMQLLLGAVAALKETP